MSDFTAGRLAGLLCLGVALSLLPATALHAATASRNDSMAVATGPIDDATEGLFVLDFHTGELTCFVVYPKGAGPRKIGGIFKANVLKDLGFDKDKKLNYLLVTGWTDFPPKGAAVRPAKCVAYVVDTNSGKVAAYGILWNPTAAAAGRPQTGPLILLDKDTVRPEKTP